MIYEYLVIISLIVGLFFAFRPLKSELKIEKFKALIVIPVVIIPIFLKNGENKPSVFVIIISSILTIYAIWATVMNFKK